MKNIAQLKQKSNEQLTNKLSELRISIMRFQGYNKGACQPPKGLVSATNREDTMFLQRLKRERAQILTLLNERKLGINKVAVQRSN